MKLSIAHNKRKNGIELLFDEELPNALTTFLVRLGFKKRLGDKNKWYADAHPAYESFATSLNEVLSRGEDWETAKLHPSFEPSLENIDKDKFSFVTISHRGKEKEEKREYVLFDSYKKVALEIATRHARAIHGDDLKDIEVVPRNYKRRARILYDKGQIIDRIQAKENPEVEKLLPKEVENEAPKGDGKTEKELHLDHMEETGIEIEDLRESPSEVSQETDISRLRMALDQVIGELLTLEDTLEGESETIIGTTLFDLEEAAEERNDMHFKNQLLKSIQLFKDWVDDLDAKSRLKAIASMHKLIQPLDEEAIPKVKPKRMGKAISKDIFSRDHLVPNVLVPSQAGEPFQSGGLNIGDANFIKFKFPELHKVNDGNLKDISALAMFQLSQMAHPKDYGIEVNRSSLLQEWEHRGAEAFEEIGFPTDLNYPYVNIHTGYRSVSPLGIEVEASNDQHKWWSVVEHARPIADLAKGIAIMDGLLMELVEKRLEVVNPKTGKPKTDKVSKAVFSDLEWEIGRLERSKQVISDYLNQDVEAEPEKASKPKKKKKPKKEDKEKEDYLDRTIATMHAAFADARRLSKKKIEALKEEVGAPSLGALWEAVELSWLLWYKMLYNEPIPFERRLQKMTLFWNEVQPTYAYSDSSKELYKQYSTPCPIGAIIAEYTGMKDAEFIFEPSAGNGLLVIGANPRRTHVNEIDAGRRRSLEHQGFGKITTENAAEPFPEMMRKVHDVVVTNPPFAKWEASKFDKQRISQKYFHKQRGIAEHIRLEHLMSGLALYTMKNDGKAAIIIMGHVHFGEDGLFAKYRPFFNWLYRHYKVDEIINMNSYKLYNKQGAVAKTMLILVGGRKSEPSGVAPNQTQAPHLDGMVETFADLWSAVKRHIKPNVETVIHQLKTARTR